MNRIAAFIDAAYLDRLPNRDRAGDIDFRILAARLARGRELLRTYYYDALPYLPANASAGLRRWYDERKDFIDRLSTVPRVLVRLGKTRCYRNDNGKTVYQQKRVDVHYATDLVLLAAKHLVTDVAIIAGDSDLIPAVSAAKEEGVVVHLFYGSGADGDLITACDERVPLSDSFMESIAFRTDSRRRPSTPA